MTFGTAKRLDLLMKKKCERCTQINTQDESYSLELAGRGEAELVREVPPLVPVLRVLVLVEGERVGGEHVRVAPPPVRPQPEEGGTCSSSPSPSPPGRARRHARHLPVLAHDDDRLLPVAPSLDEVPALLHSAPREAAGRDGARLGAGHDAALLAVTWREENKLQSNFISSLIN